MSGLPAVLKIGTKEKAMGILAAVDGQDRIMLSPNASYIRIKPSKAVSLSVPAKSKVWKDGPEEEEITGLIVPANRSVQIPLDLKVNVHKYHYLVSVNSELMKYGQVSHPTLVPPQELANLVIIFTANRKVDLADLGWIIQLAVID